MGHLYECSISFKLVIHGTCEDPKYSVSNVRVQNLGAQGVQDLRTEEDLDYENDQAERKAIQEEQDAELEAIRKEELEYPDIPF